MTFDIYTTKTCPYCVKAKMLLESKGYKYREFNVGSEVTKIDIQERVDKEGTKTVVRTVPQIFLTDNKDVYIGGYTELAAQIESL